jgi:FkbM family methyltransferase
MFFSTKHVRRNFRFLLKQNSIQKLVSYCVYSWLGRIKILTFRIYGQYIFVRTNTPDLRVALSSLGSEFSSLEKAYPKSKNGLILDAGGYIGTAALSLATMYPEATVVTIEPSSDNFVILKKNIAGKNNIYAENAALIPEKSNGNVALKSRGTGHWGFTIVENPNDRHASPVENVCGVSIEDILEKYGFSDILILKMDIEGGEHALLQQPNWLSKTQIFVVELHERIVSGCETAFQASNADRFIYKANGEKYFSIGKNFFA